MKRSMLLILMVVFTATTMFASNWIVDLKSGKLPKDFKAQVEKIGGKLINTIDVLGIAVVDFATREEAEKLGFTVMPDLMLNWLPGDKVQKAENIGLNETFYGYQWHLPLIGADLSWNAGFTGAGARVAIVDSGIWYLHPDLYYNVDFASSATFVPGTVDFIDDAGHGTHVAGIVAAADNDWGSIGVAPDATLIGVKVLNAEGSGNVSWIAAGIIHAANQDVDIINLSLGGYLKKSGNKPYYGANDVQNIINMYKKALHYARQKGALVITSAGNDTLDLAHIGNYVKVPGQLSNGVLVSATGPTDEIASYSNYGMGAITVSAPGGDFANAPNPGWYLDMILSTAPPTTPGYSSWAFMAGTSMASPVVAGVAALIVSKYGHMAPAQLEKKLVKATDDLGKPGADQFYGKGRINASKAVTK